MVFRSDVETSSKDLLALERQYNGLLRAVADGLQKLNDTIRIDSEALVRHDISKAILLRAKTHYDVQGRIQNLLGKRYSAPAADFFVETIQFYLRAFLREFAPLLVTKSEETISRKRRSIRPDISVWDRDQLVAAIECKTQLGWSRDTWEDQFCEREGVLRRDYPNAKLYLFVLTEANWGGFRNEDPRNGRQFFVLINPWPSGIEEESLDQALINPVEDLFREIVKNASLRCF